MRRDFLLIISNRFPLLAHLQLHRCQLKWLWDEKRDRTYWVVHTITQSYRTASCKQCDFVLFIYIFRCSLHSQLFLIHNLFEIECAECARRSHTPHNFQSVGECLSVFLFSFSIFLLLLILLFLGLFRCLPVCDPKQNEKLTQSWFID